MIPDKAASFFSFTVLLINIVLTLFFMLELML